MSVFESWSIFIEGALTVLRRHFPFVKNDSRFLGLNSFEFDASDAKSANIDLAVE